MHSNQVTCPHYISILVPNVVKTNQSSRPCDHLISPGPSPRSYHPSSVQSQIFSDEHLKILIYEPFDSVGFAGIKNFRHSIQNNEYSFVNNPK